MEQRISYLAKDYNDYRAEFLNLTRKYYPSMMNDFQDASVGSWFMDLIAAASDNLSSHIDKTFQETTIGSASEDVSVRNIARSQGLRVPGRKAAITEVRLSCELPVNGDYENGVNLQSPDWTYAPVVRKGTVVSSGQYKFEVMNDVNFAEQFNEEGVSNRTITPRRNSNGQIELYTVTKTAVALAGESKIYKKTLSASDIVPFMEVTLPDVDVMNVESIIFKDSTDYKSDPTLSEFMVDSEYSPADAARGLATPVWRYFEVDSLADQYRFGDVLDSDGRPVVEEFDTDYADGFNVSMVTYENEDGELVPCQVTADGTALTDAGGLIAESGSTRAHGRVASVVKGEWKPLRQKFITEFTDKNYLKIIFGSGYDTDIIPSGATTFGKFVMSRMMNNDALGVLPNAGWTMYVLYRAGGGAESNVAQGAITNFSYLNVEINGAEQTKISAVRESLRVTNTIPSLYGKDAPSVDEIKYLIKYNSGAQERCVTLKDYHARILRMPPRYGCPFRLGVTERNNKVVVSVLTTDYNGKLTTQLPTVVTENMENYLSEYRMINDYVEIRSGKIINLSFEVDVYVNRNYNAGDVVKSVIQSVQDYMDIENHQMGEDIYVSDLEKRISQLDGVINLIDLRVYNETGDGYSKTQSSLPRVVEAPCETSNVNWSSDQLDLSASDGILYADSDCMFEIKYPFKDIRVKVKTR